MSDPVASAKADPNRSYREDALVAEIERLRAEKAITADLLRYHLEKSQETLSIGSASARSGVMNNLGHRTTAIKERWDNLLLAAQACEPHLDQWEKFKFRTESGWVYVTISRSDPYPDSFDVAP